MKLKNLLVVALLAIGSITFAKDSKVNNECTSITVSINQESIDHCSITLTRITTTYDEHGNKFVRRDEATGTGSDCVKAEADAIAALTN